MKSAALIALLFSGVAEQANPLLEALAQIETGANTPKQCRADRKIGRHGEVSRYQIKPVVWKTISKSRNYSNPKISKKVAEEEMRNRIALFQGLFYREPTLKEIYCLWNAPRYILKWDCDKNPTIPAVVKERCQRFENLVNTYSKNK